MLMHSRGQPSRSLSAVLRSAAALGMLLLIEPGCKPQPQPQPPASPPTAEVPKEPPHEPPKRPQLIRPDNRKAVKALAARGARLQRNPDGNVIEVALSEATDDDLKQILKLHCVRSVYLNEAKATARGIEQLAQIRELRRLHVERTQMDDRALQAFADCPLNDLGLSGAKISDAGVRALAKIPSLKRLDVSWTEIGDQSLAALAKLPNLEQLNLAFTLISDEGLTTLPDKLPWKQIVLEGADISAAAARSLQDKLPQAAIRHSALKPKLPAPEKPEPPDPGLIDT